MRENAKKEKEILDVINDSIKTLDSLKSEQLKLLVGQADGIKIQGMFSNLKQKVKGEESAEDKLQIFSDHINNILDKTKTLEKDHPKWKQLVDIVSEFGKAAKELFVHRDAIKAAKHLQQAQDRIDIVNGRMKEVSKTASKIQKNIKKVGTKTGVSVEKRKIIDNRGTKDKNFTPHR